MREEMSIPWGPFLAAQPCRDAGPGLLLPPGAPWWAPAPTASRRVAAATGEQHPHPGVWK